MRTIAFGHGSLLSPKCTAKRGKTQRSVGRVENSDQILGVEIRGWDFGGEAGG
jgi:hypothetical protein